MSETRFSTDGVNYTSVLVNGTLTSANYPIGITATNLKDVIIGTGVTGIGNNTFRGCVNLLNIYIPNSVTFLGDACFYQCFSLTSITIPDTVTYIANNVFSECNALTMISIPDSVTFIGNNAFGYSALINIIIGTGVTRIVDNAFQGCNSLASMTFTGGYSISKIVGNNLFFNITRNLERKFYFLNTDNENDINESLLGQIQGTTTDTTVSVTGPQIFIVPDTITTVITVQSVFNKTHGDIPFKLGATSNSSAPISYSSNNTNVAAVSSDGKVTLLRDGISVITISQPAISRYTSASVTRTINVAKNTNYNPTLITNREELKYYLTTDAEFGAIENSIEVTDNLIINSGNIVKTMFSNNSDIISIVKILQNPESIPNIEVLPGVGEGGVILI